MKTLELAARISAVAVASLASAWAQTTTRVSVNSGGWQADADSVVGRAALTPDGRFVVFDSSSSMLVPGHTTGYLDVYLRDRQTGTTELVSLAQGGALGDYDSTQGAVSADARCVAFASYAGNLVPVDTNIWSDVFLRDREAGTTELVGVSTAGVQADLDCFDPILSADGRHVAFRSVATNLVPGDSNGVYDIFVRDRANGTTERVSVSSTGTQASGFSRGHSISADGRYVAFYSNASDLVPGDTNGFTDVFVRDRLSGTTERVSVATGGAQGSSGSSGSSLSADGRYVAFQSASSNLVPGDVNGQVDIFVRDRANGTTEIASIDSSGAQANDRSEDASISADGRRVAFWSFASNLTATNTLGVKQLYVRDRQAGTTEIASVNASGVPANHTNGNFFAAPSISGDGRFVAFHSQANQLILGDTNGAYDVFVRDREPALVPYCFGDGSATPCPCGNSGAPGHGCENSAATGGAVMSGSGTASVGNDSLVVVSAGERVGALSIVLQGSVSIAPASFGDGLRCVGGTLLRLYTKSAVGGVVTAPEAGDPSIRSRSEALGDLIPAGASRVYQTYYRDPFPPFCPAPSGSTWNVSSGLAVVWDY